jgi:PIN domain nuclease of toxin-antitoxin system
MSTLLLDTHVLLWAVARSERLSPLARSLCEDPDNVLLWSAVSTAELAVKVAIGKLTLPASVDAFVRRHARKLALQPLPLEDAHAAALERLPLHHRDPFDRLLVAQALVEEVPLLSADPALRRYDVELRW